MLLLEIITNYYYNNMFNNSLLMLPVFVEREEYTMQQKSLNTTHKLTSRIFPRGLGGGNRSVKVSVFYLQIPSYRRCVTREDRFSMLL